MPNAADLTEGGLSQRIHAALTARGAMTALRSKRYGLWQPISGADIVARVNAIARGLRPPEFVRGDVAAILGDNCVEWVLADLGIMAAGGISAGLDAFCDGDELARLVNLFGVSVLFVAGDEQLHKALGVRDRCPRLRQIVVMHAQLDDGAGAQHILPLADLEARGVAITTLPAVEDESIAAIVLTSGFTAPARGAKLTQEALGKQAARGAAALGLTRDDERLSLTPLHHGLERVVGVYSSLLAGTIVNLPESRETAMSDLVELQPSVVQGSPHLWARLKSGVELAIAEATAVQRRICRAALVPGRTGEANPITDRLVLAPIRRRIGLARARLCIAGGAVLRDDVADWFAALGRPLTDLYGHAETGVVSVAPHRGAPTALQGIALDRAPSGEIRIRSDALFSGYAGGGAAMRDSGWWRSGDIALINEQGLPHPVGRLDDMLPDAANTTASFETESALVSSPYIADAFLHHDSDGRTVAAILMHSDAVVKYAQDNSIPFTHFLSLCRSNDIRALIGQVVTETNARAPSRIDDFVLIERSLGPSDPEVGPTLALRRRLIRPIHHTQLHEISATN